MRKTIFTLALALPLGLAACASEEAADTDAVYEDEATTVVDEPMSEEMEEMVEDGAPAGDMEDVIGDGEIIDEPGEIEPDNPDDDVMEDAIID